MPGKQIIQSLNNNSDYSMTLYETCEYLAKSARTISRYIHKNVLHPREFRSRQGSLEYRFSRIEVERLREREMILRPYVYEGSPPAAPSYAANFADYNAAAASPAQPQTAPYLAPGVPFIAPQNQVQFKNPPAVWPPNCDPAVASSAQGYDRQSFQDMCSRKAEKHERRESKIKTDDPAVETKKELRSVPKETRDTANKEIISLLKETTEMLRGQLKAKDDQIKNLDDKIGQLIERNRETNILLKGLQDKIMLLEKPKTESHKDYHSEPARETEFSTPDSGASIDERQKNKKNSVPITVENDLPVSENDKQDTIQPSAPPIADKPVFSKEAKIEKIQKKGLFGKIFG